MLTAAKVALDELSISDPTFDIAHKLERIALSDDYFHNLGPRAKDWLPALLCIGERQRNYVAAKRC